MAVDNPPPLCTPADMQSGAFADLVRSFGTQALADMCVEASRECESVANRRFLPFTINESQRAEGVDPEELGGLGPGGLMDYNTAQGVSYANALGGGGGQVRKVWLDECAVRYSEMWAYSGVVVSVTASIGGTNVATPMKGPMADTGLLWFNIGTYCPPGSLIEITYSGGYNPFPASLRRAGKYMTAAIACRELDPDSGTGHDEGNLQKLAEKALMPYMRS